MFGRAAFAAALLVAWPSAPLAAQETTDRAESWSAWTDACEDWDEWDKPGPPVRIHGNTFYVGTCGIGAILVTGDLRHVLIDSGTEAGAEVVLRNFRALGFDPRDVRMILQSHEHWDHVGGMARIIDATGATLLTNRTSWLVYETGQPDPADPQFGTLEVMAPAKVGSTIEGGMKIGSHKLLFQSIATPGHTPGALSWQWQSCDDTGDCRTIVYADSLSPVSADGYRFSDHPDYVQAYRDGLARLAALDCDILLTPHPSASGMRDKLLADDLTAGPDCADYAASITARLDTRLAEETETSQ